MSTIALRNLDGRARPQPDVKCRVCGEMVTQLQQIMRHGKHSLACATCAAKRCYCPVCDDYVERVGFVPISENASQSVCEKCAETVRYSPPDAPNSRIDDMRGVVCIDRPDDPYCVGCFHPFTAKYPHQHRCTDCAESIAAQWAAVPPTPKPPKLVLVKEPEKLSPMVLWRAMWLQVWADWQRAHNPMVLIRQMDRNIKAGPGVAKRAEVPKWELWSEDEFRQKMVVPRAA